MNHLEFAAAESAALSPTRWDSWIGAAGVHAINRGLPSNLDGDESRDGYSLDFAYDAFRSEVSARAYVDSIKTRGSMSSLRRSCTSLGGDPDWKGKDHSQGKPGTVITDDEHTNGG